MSDPPVALTVGLAATHWASGFAPTYGVVMVGGRVTVTPAGIFSMSITRSVGPVGISPLTSGTGIASRNGFTNIHDGLELNSHFAWVTRIPERFPAPPNGLTPSSYPIPMISTAGA